jgi:CBS domain-containing protein
VGNQLGGRNLCTGLTLAEEKNKMRLNAIMSQPVSVISANATISEAAEQMDRARIHHLVVLNKKEVVGVISRSDLDRAAGSGTVSDVMATDVATATPETTIREAANLLRGRSIGCLPLLERGRVVGIVTTADLLTLLGKGTERPVATSTRRTLRGRAPRRPPVAHAHGR